MKAIFCYLDKVTHGFKFYEQKSFLDEIFHRKIEVSLNFNGIEFAFIITKKYVTAF